VGAAMTILIKTNGGDGFAVGFFPGFIGVALLVYVYLLAAPVE
jgi:hypothetical protein